MQRQFESWIGVVRPWVEESYGPLPNFSIHPAKIKTYPFAVASDFIRGTGTIVYDPDWFSETGPYRDVLSEEIQYHGSGVPQTLIGLVHELVHLYQLKPLSEKIGFWRFLPFGVGEACTYLQYNHWLEGSAELAAMEVNFRHMDSELPADSRQRNLLEMLQSDAYQLAFHYQYSNYLSYAVSGLAKSRMIPEASLKALGLPFQVPDSIKRSVKEKIPDFAPQKPFSYTRGLARCTLVISQEGMSVGDLLRLPLTNDELRSRAGV